MGGILELIKLIYGSKALSKVLGTRTNVIRLPDNELKQYTKKELNIEAASNKLAQKVKADMYELLAEYPRMNDAEKLIFDGNLRRLGNKLEVVQKKQKPAADVLEFETGEKVSPEGIMSLTEKAGQKNPPTTLMGNLESRIKQLEASGEDLSKMKGQTYDEFMNDITQGQRTMIKLEDEGLVRATAREIIDKDIKSKKIKLPKEIEADFKQGGGEPIDVFRQFYGEDALEQLNSMVPDFRQMYSPREAAEAATKKFNFEFKADRAPGSISIEDARKAEQEFGINKPKQTEVTDITAKVYRNADPDELINEYNKNLNLLSQVDEDGGTLIGYEQFKKLQNRNTEIEKILDSINIKSADSPEGKKITEALIGKPKASVTELVTAEKIISDMKKMDPMDAMKEANKVLKKEGKYKNLKEEDVERIMEDTNDFIFGRDIPEDPEGFATGGRVGFKEGLGYFSNLIKENIPPEYRLYAKSILPGGKKGNVDESYFTEDFKKDLRQQVLTKFKETGKLKGAIGELDTHYRSGAKKYGQGETYPINKLIGLPSTYATLGSYNYEIDPETLDVKIKDTYDWNPAYGKDSSSGKTGWVGDKKGKDVDTSMLKDYVMQSLKTGVIDKGDALELLGNYLGPKASKGEGINVDLDIPAQDISMEEGETFATGGRVRMAGGGILKLAMKFFNDNNPVSAYKKYLKYVKETAQKDPAKLAPEMGGIVVGSELIHRGLRRKLKEAKEKNDTDDSEDTTTEDRTEKAGGGVSQGLDYLMGIERRGYANGDYVVQAGIKNYLGKQKTATVPIKWKSGKDHPDTELAYITKPEKELLLKLDMHNSMPDGEPNIGPGGLISLNGGGGGSEGAGTSDSGGDSGGFDGTEGTFSTDTSDTGASDTGGESSYTDYSDADMGPVGNYTMFDEATAKANLQSVVDNMKAKMTKDMDPLQRSAFNLSINNPFTSTFGKIGNSVLSPIGTILSSFSYNPDFAGDRKYTDYGNTSSYFTGDESDGGGRDERTPISSFDSALFSPDLAKNRDYRLYQGANNPFYSMQAVPSGGIKNVYTEFKKGGRVGFALGGLNYLTGL
jgi:hypothetical protein